MVLLLSQVSFDSDFLIIVRLIAVALVTDYSVLLLLCISLTKVRSNCISAPLIALISYISQNGLFNEILIS